MGGDGQVFAFLSGEIGLDDGTDEKFSFFSGEGSGTEDEILQQEIRTDWITPLCLVGLSLISVLFIRSAQAYVGESMEDADRVVWNWLLGLFCGFVDQLPDLDEIRPLFLCLGDSRLAFGFQRAGFVRSPEVD